MIQTATKAAVINPTAVLFSRRPELTVTNVGLDVLAAVPSWVVVVVVVVAVAIVLSHPPTSNFEYAVSTPFSSLVCCSIGP